MKKLLTLLTGILFLLCLSTVLFSQTKNLYVESDGDQVNTFHSLPGVTGGAGSVSLDLLRGDENGLGDWRILNDADHLRIQNGINNFMTAGTNRISILDNGLVGIGCTNPQAKLSICSGQIGFSNALAETAADKISLDGYTFDQPHMVGLGYETSNYFDGMNLLEVSDLYFKSEGAHRWYSNANADVGVSASMVLNRDGDLGIDVSNPDARLHIVGGTNASLSDNGYIVLGETSGTNLTVDRNEIQARNAGASSHLQLQKNGGNVGVGIILPEVTLHVGSGSDVNLAGGGYFMMGTSGNLNIAMDNNEIQARDGGNASDLHLQASGGNVGIGNNTAEVKLHITDGTDVAPLSGGYVQIGNTLGENIAIDNNEIMARDNATGGTLHLQRDAGDLLLCAQEVGQVGIGIADPANLPSDTDYLLAVDGKIISEEVRVELSAGWPDYVFEESYDLMPLEKLEKSIESNNHLPGIPSAKEVEGDGLVLGEMQRRMMEKIEELTLYVIDLNKQNQQLQEQLNELKKK